MQHMTEVVVKSGDTISTICSKIYGMPPSQTKPHWDEFWRRDKATQKLIRIDGMIYVGETIFHEKKSAAPKHPTSHVTKASPQAFHGAAGKTSRPLTKKESDRLKKIIVKSREQIVHATHILGKYSSSPKIRGLVNEVFMLPTYKGSEHSNRSSIQSILVVYNKMLKDDEISIYRASDDNWNKDRVEAFTDVGHKHRFIAVRSQVFFGQSTSTENLAAVLVHELAHYSANKQDYLYYSDLNTSEVGADPLDLNSKSNDKVTVSGETSRYLENADTYASFALRASRIHL